MAIQKISSTVIGSGAVTSEQIATGAITAADIPDGEITTAKLADDAVTTAKIAANAVTSTEIADSQITTSKIADGNITSAKMANDITIGGNIQAADYILEGISTNLADTAVDVFIYDTSKDSDGGEWRNRTQDTSWYNEELNTATRGSRREFPAVAVIVVDTTDKITIYDGDDPDLPMWMIANTSNQMFFESNPFCVSAVNAKIAIGNNPYDLAVVDFLKDESIEYATGRITVWSGGIAKRNEPNSSLSGQNIETYGIIDRNVNDVAMTVLPNAPIDAATGLPVPTIAVATDGGVSVIKDNGTVVDITAGGGASYNGVSWIDITENNNLIFEQDSGSRAVFCIPIPSRDRTTETNDGSINDKVIMKWYANGAHEPYPCYNGGGVVEAIGLAGDNQALRSEYGDLTILEPNLASPEYGKVAYISTYYNTGWMPGNIKGAWLSDTTQETITGEKLSSNTFYNTGWSAYGAGDFVINANGTVSVTGTGDKGESYLSSPAFTTEVGKTYVISLTTSGSSGTGIGIYPYNTNGPNAYVWDRDFYFTSTNASTEFFLYRFGGHIGSATLTSISVKEVDVDRSVNNNGLKVFGNITKTPVATGADLVAYSGFSASNYLQQPYNSALAAGTGTQTFIAWFKLDSTPGTANLIHRGTLDSAESLRIAVTNSNIYFDYGGGTDYATASFVPSIGVWTCIVATVTAGQFGKIYLNGKLQVNNTQFVAPSTFLDASTYVTTIGGSHAYGGWFNGSIALARYSLSTISDQQVLKLYEDEKVLFQENSKATLYGASNAVTALAYDDDTNLLHVGTSSGRSEFQGLRRINNTTDAVSTAISANNGMVAEQ